MTGSPGFQQPGAHVRRSVGDELEVRRLVWRVGRYPGLVVLTLGYALGQTRGAHSEIQSAAHSEKGSEKVGGLLGNALSDTDAPR